MKKKKIKKIETLVDVFFLSTSVGTSCITWNDKSFEFVGHRSKILCSHKLIFFFRVLYVPDFSSGKPVIIILSKSDYLSFRLPPLRGRRNLLRRGARQHLHVRLIGSPSKSHDTNYLRAPHVFCRRSSPRRSSRKHSESKNKEHSEINVVQTVRTRRRSFISVHYLYTRTDMNWLGCSLVLSWFVLIVLILF